MGYPDAAEEDAILQRFERSQPLEELNPVVESEQLRQMVKTVEDVRVSDTVRGYIVEIVQASRQEKAFELGASPTSVASALAHDPRVGRDSRSRFSSYPTTYKRWRESYCRIA